MSQKEDGKFLTEKQIEYLSGAHDPPTPNAENQTRSKIRKRFAGVLEDVFWINNLSDKDLELIFKGVGEITTKGTTIDTSKECRDILPGHEAGIHSFIALSCRGYMQHDVGPSEFISSSVKSGVRKAVADKEDIKPSRVSVDIQTSVTIDDLDALEKWKRDGKGLTPEDMQELHEQVSNHPDVDDITGKNLNDLIDEHLVESDE